MSIIRIIGYLILAFGVGFIFLGLKDAKKPRYKESFRGLIPAGVIILVCGLLVVYLGAGLGVEINQLVGRLRQFFSGF